MFNNVNTRDNIAGEKNVRIEHNILQKFIVMV